MWKQNYFSKVKLDFCDQNVSYLILLGEINRVEPIILRVGYNGIVQIGAVKVIATFGVTRISLNKKNIFSGYKVINIWEERYAPEKKYILVTDQYRYEMLRKFGSQLNIKNHPIEFPTVGQNKTKFKLNLEIKGKTISIVGVLFFSGISPIVVAMWNYQLVCSRPLIGLK